MKMELEPPPLCMVKPPEREEQGVSPSDSSFSFLVGVVFLVQEGGRCPLKTSPSSIKDHVRIMNEMI